MGETTVPQDPAEDKADESVYEIEPQDRTPAQHIQVSIDERMSNIKLLESDDNLFSKGFDRLSPQLRPETIRIYHEEIEALRALDPAAVTDESLQALAISLARTKRIIRYMEPIPAFDSNIHEVITADSISLFETAPGTKIAIDVAFDEDAQRTGRLVIEVVETADRKTWDRGSFRILEADLPFEPESGQWAGRSGYVDAAITYRRGLRNPLALGQAARISKGRHLIMTVISPDDPDMGNRWIPFVLDCSVVPEETPDP